MSEALEQMLEEVKPDFSGNSQYSTLDNYAVSVPKDAMYGNIDSYLGGTLGFYSFDFDPEPPLINPIGGPGSPKGIVQRPDYLEGGIEKFRRPEYDDKHGNHMNYEITIPGIKKPILNEHIPLGEDYFDKE